MTWCCSWVWPRWWSIFSASLGLAWCVAIEYTSHIETDMALSVLSFIKLRRFCFMIYKLFRLLLCVSELVCTVLVTSPLTFLPVGFDKYQIQIPIPNIGTIRVNNYILFMYANRLKKKESKMLKLVKRIRETYWRRSITLVSKTYVFYGCLYLYT